MNRRTGTAAPDGPKWTAQAMTSGGCWKEVRL